MSDWVRFLEREWRGRGADYNEGREEMIFSLLSFLVYYQLNNYTTHPSSHLCVIKNPNLKPNHTFTHFPNSQCIFIKISNLNLKMFFIKIQVLTSMVKSVFEW